MNKAVAAAQAPVQEGKTPSQTEDPTVGPSEQAMVGGQLPPAETPGHMPGKGPGWGHPERRQVAAPMLTAAGAGPGRGQWPRGPHCPPGGRHGPGEWETGGADMVTSGSLEKQGAGCLLTEDNSRERRGRVCPQPGRHCVPKGLCWVESRGWGLDSEAKLAMRTLAPWPGQCGLGQAPEPLAFLVAPTSQGHVDGEDAK